MKKLTNLMLGCLAGIALAACSQKPDQPGLNPDGETVRIQLEAPEALQLTRSIPGTNSAQGGLTNVDWSQYDLRYLLAVYSADGSELLTRLSKTYDTYSSAVFELRLTPNNSYKFVAWADFVAEGEDEDLHYNTTDLANITLKSYEDGRQNQINDESRDAYFATKVINVTQTFDEPLTLKRPLPRYASSPPTGRVTTKALSNRTISRSRTTIAPVSQVSTPSPVTLSARRQPTAQRFTPPPWPPMAPTASFTKEATMRVPTIAPCSSII